LNFKKTQNWKLGMFTRSNLKTPKLDIKRKKPQIAQSWENKIEDPINYPKFTKTWKKQNGRLQKLIRTKLKNSKLTKKKNALSSQNKIVKV
jgi:transposase-like protein